MSQVWYLVIILILIGLISDVFQWVSELQRERTCETCRTWRSAFEGKFRAARPRASRESNG